MTEVQESDETAAPPITVVLSTRNRGDKIRETVGTILRNNYPKFELTVVDQSDHDLTEASLQAFRMDPRFRYVRTATTGLAAGRNLGIRGAQSEIIAITDDDCQVPANWLRELAAAFAVESRIGIVFGNVVPGSHDQTAGLVPGYVRDEPFLARSIREKYQVEGMGACMGLRRSVWRALGGFDQRLGAGAPFKAGEEGDLAIRALLAGHFIYETPRVAVVHNGFRTREQARTLIHCYWYGTGAMLAKHIKCGHWLVVHLLARLAWRWAFGQSVVAVSFGDSLHRVLRLSAFIQGFVAGAVTPIDRTTGHYLCRNKDPGHGR